MRRPLLSLLSLLALAGTSAPPMQILPTRTPRTEAEQEQALDRAALRLLWRLRPVDTLGDRYRSLIEALQLGGFFSDELPADSWEHVCAGYQALTGNRPPGDRGAMLSALRSLVAEAEGRPLSAHAPRPRGLPPTLPPRGGSRLTRRSPYACCCPACRDLPDELQGAAG